jgi:hypothetical protein
MTPASPIKHAWLTRLAHRISSSSGAHALDAHFAPCVLDLLEQERPQPLSTRKAGI